MDPITILAAFIPLLGDLGKQLINRYITPDTIKPSSVAEYVQLRDADIRFFQAMNSDSSTDVYPWVNSIVKLQRPFVAAIVLGIWAYVHAYMPGTDTTTIDNFASAVGFYLFGDRTLFYIRKAPAK